MTTNPSSGVIGSNGETGGSTAGASGGSSSGAGSQVGSGGSGSSGTTTDAQGNTSYSTDASGGYYSKDATGNTFYNDAQGNQTSISDSSGKLTSEGQAFYNQGLMPQNAGRDPNATTSAGENGYSKAQDGSLYYTDSSGNTSKLYNSDGTMTQQGQAFYQSGQMPAGVAAAAASSVTAKSGGSSLGGIVGSIGNTVSSLATSAYNTLAKAVGLPQVSAPGQTVAMINPTTGQPVTVNGVPQTGTVMSNGTIVPNGTTYNSAISTFGAMPSGAYPSGTYPSSAYPSGSGSVSMPGSAGYPYGSPYASSSSGYSPFGSAMTGGMGSPSGGGWNLASLSGFGLPGGSISGIITNIAMWLLAIFGIVGVIGFVIAGIMYLASFGDDTRMQTAKKAMLYSIIGIVVGLAGLVIITAVTAMLSGTSF